MVEEFNNFDYDHTAMQHCGRCQRDTKMEVYQGHTFSEGMTLTICLECGEKRLS